MKKIYEYFFGCFHKWSDWHTARAMIYCKGLHIDENATIVMRKCEKCGDFELKSMSEMVGRLVITEDGLTGEVVDTRKKKAQKAQNLVVR